LLLVVLITWLVLIYWAYREKSWPLWLVVVGGGLNLYQRWQWGYVIDYWKIPGTLLYNNINDWLIFIGFGTYLWTKFRQKKLK
jgi:lipoprotein signal peptidase